MRSFNTVIVFSHQTSNWITPQGLIGVSSMKDEKSIVNYDNRQNLFDLSLSLLNTVVNIFYKVSVLIFLFDGLYNFRE